MCQIVERGVALLGYAAVGSAGLVLLATRTRPAAVLPGGHVVRLVTESRWVIVPLQARHCSGLGLGFRPRVVLPVGHVVRLVTESRWVTVPLQARPTSSPLGKG